LKDTQVGVSIQAMKEQQFVLEQRTGEYRLAEKALRKEKQKTALPWHRQLCALIGLYGKTMTVMVLLLAIGTSGGIFIGTLNSKQIMKVIEKLR
jgi:hypothetical protein